MRKVQTSVLGVERREESDWAGTVSRQLCELELEKMGRQGRWALLARWRLEGGRTKDLRNCASHFFFSFFF